MLTSDEHTDDLRTYLKSLTEAVDTAATHRAVPASSSGRRRWPVVAGIAAALLAVVGGLVLFGMDDRQSVSTADDGEVGLTQGWRTVEYGDVAFDVPPGWVEQEPSPCDLRVNVRGYYLLPIRAEGPGGGGCASPAEHWDTRDTLMLHLLPNESTYPVPSDAEAIVTEGGLEGFAWNNGERHTEYYFPEEHLRAATYRSLEPEVDPASVVLTLRRVTPDDVPRPLPESPTEGLRVDPSRYVPAAAIAQLASFPQPVLLPGWVPGWADGAEHHTFADTQNQLYWSSWSVEYGTHPMTLALDSGLQIQLSVSTLDDGDEPFAENSVRRETEVRSYVIGDSVVTGDCGETPDGPDGVVASWDEDGRRYHVLMVPNAGCAEEFTIEAALAFADAVVPCESDGETLTCG